ncbi:MAG: hypothetical protein QXE68_03730 [Sulfolobales archaeon]
MMWRVRISRSIVLGYVSLIIRFLSSLLFSIIVVRSLSSSEFSVWVFGFSILPLFSMGYDFWGWIYARRYALGIRSALYAGVILNVVYAVLSSSILLLLSGYLLGYLGSQYIYLSLFVFNLSLSALASFASYTSSTLRPDIFLSSSLVFELSRVATAAILIRALKMGLSGAILSPAIASLISSLYIIILLRRSGLLKFYLDHVWREIINTLRMSVAGVAGSIASVMWNLDRIFLTIISKSYEAVSYLGVGYSLRGIIIQLTSVPSTAIYAKLLEDSKYPLKDLTMLTLSISIPSLAIMILLSKPLISLLNPLYINAFMITSIMIFEGFISSLSSLMISIATGIDRRDLQAENLRGFLSSSIARVRIANFIRATVFSITSLAYSITLSLRILPEDPLLSMLIISLLLLILSTSYMFFSLSEMRKYVRIGLKLGDLIPIIISSTMAILYLSLVKAYDIVILSVWRDLPILLIHGLIALGIYILALYILSDWFRYFIRRYVLTLVQKF